MADFVSAIGQVYGFTTDELRSDIRTAKLAEARQAAYWLIRTASKASYPQIGAYFFRDHTTIMHGAQKTVVRAMFDPATCDRLQRSQDGAWAQLERRVASVMARDVNRAQILSMGASMPHLS